MKRRIHFLFALFICSVSSVAAQYTITAREGYSPQIGILVDMLDNSRNQILEAIKELDPADLDYRFDDQANTIGALLMHLIATQSYYQVQSLEERSWDEQEEAFWTKASNVEENSKGALRGKDLSYYREVWDKVHGKTLVGLKQKDDAWLQLMVDDGINHHYIWFHVFDHQANHLGQISVIINRLKSNDE